MKEYWSQKLDKFTRCVSETLPSFAPSQKSEMENFRKTDLCCLSSFPIRRILENLQKESKITIQLVLIIAFSIEFLFYYLHYFPALRLLSQSSFFVSNADVK